MKKTIGIAVLLLVIGVVTSLLSWSEEQKSYTFLSAYNLQNLLQRIGLFGILAIAASFVIVTGGIDLSIGSVVCVAGCLLPWLVQHEALGLGLNPWLALSVVVLLGAVLGLGHGLLVTRLSLQPFVVTLCGLLFYRGVMRAFTADRTMGFGNSAASLDWLATGRLSLGEDFGIPVPFLVLVGLAAVTAAFLRWTVWGRHLLALGRNEEAARFSGVPTKRLVVFAYIACSALAALGGSLFVLDVNSAQASSFGSFYELYAIAGAVLGGCALRGGEAAVLGVVLGASLMQVLQNAIRLVGRSDQLEYAIVGAVILLGAAADEIMRRIWRRRARS